MNELRPSSLTMRTSDAHDGMCLLLDSVALNAGEPSSLPSPSSSLPSSGKGGTSPDSACSTGRMDSLVDEDAPEGMMGRKVAAREDDSGIQSPDCTPDGDGGNNIEDNSVSIYLDAYGDSWQDDRNDHDVTLAATQQRGYDRHRGGDQVGDSGGERSSDGCSLTEPPSGSSEDEEDDDEEDSFLSLSSVAVVTRGHGESGKGQETVVSHTEGTISGPSAAVMSSEMLPRPGPEGRSVGTEPPVSVQDPPEPVPTLPAPSVRAPSRTILKRFPRPDLRNIGAKVVCRSASAPRPANPTRPQATPGWVDGDSEKKPPPVRGRAANRREQGSKKGGSSSNGTRAAAQTPTSVWGSRPRPQAAPSQAEKRPRPTISTARQGTGVIADHDQEPMEGVVVEVEAERGMCAEESPGNEIQMVPSELTAPAGVGFAPQTAPGPSGGRQGTPSRGPRPGVSGCVSARVRDAPPAGVPKMKVMDSTAGGCGPASSRKAHQNPAPSKLPIKSASLPTSLSSSSLGSAASENNRAATANTGAAAVMKAGRRSIRTPSSSQGRERLVSSRPPTGLKAPVMAGYTAAKTTHNALQRSGVVRPNRPSAAAVEKNVRVGVSSGVRVARVRSGPDKAAGPAAHAEEDKDTDLRLQIERRDVCIGQLRELVARGDRSLEALALVIQHILREREEAGRQRKEFSLQLKNLQEELTNSASCCERLRREKAQASAEMEAAMRDLRAQHSAELARLQEALEGFYSAEWDKAHRAYQEEAEKCRALALQQVEEVRSKQEAVRGEQEVAHTQQMEALKQEYEISLAELKKAHEQDLRKMDHALIQSEASLNKTIESLQAENTDLNARLREEEDRRKALADKSQKDSRVLYLEQELESLKVVLEIKTNQLHQQDKKLMQMDRLIESNVKLEECLNKLQQENEDYKARMDKHAALSKQLSSEQAMLQQTLQNESKANKRLSMENEELLWKLHNGDLSSPRRLSPSSPFHSPRNSASFPGTPVSPR
ncbi:microtubule-associated tumor suppressor 1 homolog [Electrophorus electricus]|uniref:Microtubule associated tumor suppressor 1b n=1 Tax=Electrophorus electricus TaxID=8005 RepID=A0A4W4HC64_ELEEL|nr:microtubule-associated tumor suppressor 1 homolog [Electrophorus electricus]XP_035385433.1 microtubule-associated tumor suppressor 1 homolog [Electrophorus electricus]